LSGSEVDEAFHCLIITNVCSFPLVVALGALPGYSTYYEAGNLTVQVGAQFRTITIPLIRPVMIPSILGISAISNLNIVWLVSNGGEPSDKTHNSCLVRLQTAFISTVQLCGGTIHCHFPDIVYVQHDFYAPIQTTEAGTRTNPTQTKKTGSSAGSDASGACGVRDHFHFPFCQVLNISLRRATSCSRTLWKFFRLTLQSITRKNSSLNETSSSGWEQRARTLTVTFSGVVFRVDGGLLVFALQVHGEEGGTSQPADDADVPRDDAPVGRMTCRFHQSRTHQSYLESSLSIRRTGASSRGTSCVVSRLRSPAFFPMNLKREKP